MELTKEQQRVYSWLNEELELPVFAEAYKGALFLLETKSSGYVSFTAHAGRDLINRLASTVAGIDAGRVQYHEHLDKLIPSWREEWTANNPFSENDGEKGHFIPSKVCLKIATLIEEHKVGRIRSSDADGLFFSTFLDYADKDKIPRNFLSEWKEAKNWFLKHAHLRQSPFRNETEGELDRHFRNLDGYLYIAASSQYERLRELNDILDRTNG